MTPISLENAAEPSVREAVRAIVELALEGGTLGDRLVSVAKDIDPHGLVFPELVAARLAEGVGPTGLRRLAAVARAYAIRSAPWRTIAVAVLRASSSLRAVPPEFGNVALADTTPRSWSAPRGDVPAEFETAVSEAEEALRSETDADLRSYWGWCLDRAKASLNDQAELAREERGE